MENGYIDIDAYVRQANKDRSDAMAALLSLSWQHLTQWVAHLLHHQPHGHGHFAKS
ncbi:hypothetical protein HUU62_06960 [Rhodoferax sp. 4810]|nr:hypothetical protein [Rhodoferax jenense]